MQICLNRTCATFSVRKTIFGQFLHRNLSIITISDNNQFKGRIVHCNVINAPNSHRNLSIVTISDNNQFKGRIVHCNVINAPNLHRNLSIVTIWDNNQIIFINA